MRRAFLLFIVLTAACGGRIQGDTDAGDAAVLDASTGDAAFVCGEGNTFVICEPSTEYCLLVTSSHARHYSCVASADGGAPSCAGFPAASSPGDCGCYASSNGEVFVVECQ